MACLAKNRCDRHFAKGDQACAGCPECGNDPDVGDEDVGDEDGGDEDGEDDDDGKIEDEYGNKGTALVEVSVDVEVVVRNTYRVCVKVAATDRADAEYKAETAALEDLDASSIVETGSVVYEADPEAESAVSQDSCVVEGELG